MSDSQSSTTTTNLTSTTTDKQQVEQKRQQLDRVSLFREVKSKKEHSICEPSSSSPSTSSQLSSSYKPIDVNVDQFDSGTRKLTSPHLKYLNRELNNNTITATTLETSNTLSSFKNMDSKERKSSETNNGKSTASGLNQPGSAVIDLNNYQGEEQEVESQQSQTIPSYSSIFAPRSYRNSLSSHQIATQQQQQNNQTVSGRLPLRKQIATFDSDSTIISKQNNNSNRLGAFSHTSNKSSENQLDDDDVEAEDNDIDERLPFNSSMTKFRSINSKGLSPEFTLGCQSSNNKTGNSKQNHAFPNYDHRCEKSSKNPQTKISFNESRPPSFNLCQANYNHHDNMYPNLRSEQQICPKCDCNNCCMKRKFILMDGYEKAADSNNLNHHHRKYARTRSLHLALKSVILVLLTLLLLILLIGIILASHYLPQVFDRVLNVSRSFNVTIAG